jgi:predicted TIM-barrel fold metal-dependent hydrolase
MKIDFHAHISPMPYVELLKKNNALMRNEWMKEDPQLFRLLTAPDERLKLMDRLGIDIHVLSLILPGCDHVDPSLGIQLARVANDEIAALVDRHPDRFVGLASLPFKDAKLAVPELERAVKKLGLRGIMLFSNAGGKPLDSPDLEPIYAKAEELGVPIMLHPTIPLMAEIFKDHGILPLHGLSIDCMIGALKIIMSGVPERHPGLDFVVPHYGEGIVFFQGKLDYVYERLAAPPIPKPPMEYFRKMYIDTAVLYKPSFQCAYSCHDHDRIVWGTDFPIQDTSRHLKLMDELDIPDADRAKIFELNSKRLLKL